MASPLAYLDGTQAYGVTIGTSGVLTIGGVAYKVNNFTPDRPVQAAQDYNPNGSPNRQRVTADFATFTAELQLATSSTAPPTMGMTFTATIDSNFGAELWAIDTVTPAQTNETGAIRVAQITGRKVYNGSVTLVNS